MTATGASFGRDARDRLALTISTAGVLRHGALEQPPL